LDACLQLEWQVYGLGNGDMAGSISYGSMAATLFRGYATSSTDTGHEGTNMDGSYALGHREKVIDFGNRAVHEMTVNAKLIIAAYYGRMPKFSCWNGVRPGQTAETSQGHEAVR
jgi:feruloyl esterase